MNSTPHYDSIPQHNNAAVRNDDGHVPQEYSIPIQNVPDDDINTIRTSTTASTESMRSVWDPEDGDQRCHNSLPRTSHQAPPMILDDGVAAWIFWFLGFESNPLQSTSQTRKGNTRNSAGADLRLSMLSNYSTAYNIISISLALNMMAPLYPYTTPADKSLCSSALIAGMIIGQLTGGAMGDLLGRHMAMTFVMLLQVFASFASAFSFDVMHESLADSYLSGVESVLEEGIPSVRIYYSLAIFRFILGLGCGGVYPLAATLTAESSSSEEDRGKLVALTFSMQGFGSLTVPVVALLLIGIFGDRSDYAWRYLLGFGCIPGAALTVLRLQRMMRAQVGVRRKSAAVDHTKAVPVVKPTPKPDSIFESIKAERNLVPKLLGTAGCWFLFDILFYGNTLFQPVVLAAAFGKDETVTSVARDTLFIAALALPGYIVSIMVVGKLTPRFIQLQGFMIMAVLYAIIGYYFESLAGNRWLLLSLYGSTFFFSNFGPNSTVSIHNYQRQ